MVTYPLRKYKLQKQTVVLRNGWDVVELIKCLNAFNSASQKKRLRVFNPTHNLIPMKKELWEEKPDSIDTNSIDSDLPWNEGCWVVETVTRLDKKSFVQISDGLLFFLKWKKMDSIERDFIVGEIT